jgi:subtilase family serine protease
MIKNRGGGRSEKARAAFYIDGKFAGSPDIPEIEASEETPITLQWIATGGSHTVSVVADYDNMLAETAEDNNKLTATISIISPDLFIPSIGWLPENFVIDDMVTFSVNITNRGGGRAENFYVAYYMDDILVTSKPVARLDSGASVNKTWTWKALNGRHTFKAIANYNKYIIEENENNNENAVTVAPNMPDLTVETVTWSPADIAAGKDVKFDITIKNTGTLTAGPTRVAYYIDGVVTGFNDIGQLEPGAVVTVHYTWSALAGLHTIDIVTDSTDQVSEIDEANNAKTVSLPPPDLVIQDISWSPEDAATGDPVTLTATVKNQGYSRSQKTQVTCYIDGKAIGTKDLAEIEPGASSQVAFDWTAEPGAHKIKVTADVNNRVTESDETNNFKETDLAALTPDLVVQDITWLMKSPLTDDRVDFVITVRNQGTGKAGASLMIYTVDDMPGLTEDIAALPAGDSVSADFSLILKAGPHTVNVSLDTETEVSELDETNNERSLSFSTIAPDLVIETISLAPADPVPGDNVTITVKLGNQGKDKVLAPKLSLSVDGSPVGEAEAEEIEIGGIASLDFSWIATAGQHDIVAYADISKQITESNETNNSRTRTVSIESPPVQVPKSVNLSTTTDKGLIASWWWLLLVVAALLGGTAFYSALRSFKKE